MKKYIIPSSIVLLIVVGVLLLNFKNTSDEQSVQTNIQEEEIKTETQTKTNTGELTTESILSQLDEQVEMIEPEVDENNEPEVVPDPKPKVKPVIVEKPKPVVVQEQKPVVATTQPDFLPHEYFRNSEDEAPQVYRYEPKPEWILPNGNPEEFNLDSSKGLNHAYGSNYKQLYITLYPKIAETNTATLIGMTELIKKYSDNSFYFTGDNEEGERLWQIHIEATPQESIKLIGDLKNDTNIIRVRQVEYILPQFKSKEKIIEDKFSEYSTF